MIPFGLKGMALGATVATSICLKGVKKKSLSKSGAVTAWFVGFFSISCGLRGFLVFFFYQLGSSATKFKKGIKERLDSAASEGAVRGPHQVLACSIIAIIFGLIHAVVYGEEKPIDFVNYPSESALTCGIIAHYACCCADTLASELGILSNQSPFLITMPWINVPRGTNGGVTLLGLFWSALGGAFMSLGTLFLDWISDTEITNVSVLLMFGTACGLLGSLLDSILGATVQSTYYDEEKKQICSSGNVKSESIVHICGYDLLSNAQVNIVSVFATTLLGGYVVGPLFYNVS